MGVTFIHPQAYVEDVMLGDGTKVWQFASIIRGSVIGRECNIGSCAIIDGAEIGDHCLVSHGASLNPGLFAGASVFFGPNCTICNDRRPAANKHGFDSAALFDGFVTVKIHDGASIGANAVVLPGVTIGKGSVIAAGAIVRHDVAPNHLLTRSGMCRKISSDWRMERMRETS